MIFQVSVELVVFDASFLGLLYIIIYIIWYNMLYVFWCYMFLFLPLKIASLKIIVDCMQFEFGIKGHSLPMTNTPVLAAKNLRVWVLGWLKFGCVFVWLFVCLFVLNTLWKFHISIQNPSESTICKWFPCVALFPSSGHGKNAMGKSTINGHFQ